MKESATSIMNDIDLMTKVLVLNHTTSIKEASDCTDEVMYEYITSEECTQVIIERFKEHFIILITVLLILQEVNEFGIYIKGNAKRHRNIAVLAMLVYSKLNFKPYIGEIIRFATSGQYAYEVHRLRKLITSVSAELAKNSDKISADEYTEYQKYLAELLTAI